MASEYALTCMMCGRTYEVESTDAGQLTAAKQGGTVHICDTCKRKVQVESENKFK